MGDVQNQAAHEAAQNESWETKWWPKFENRLSRINDPQKLAETISKYYDAYFFRDNSARNAASQAEARFRQPQDTTTDPALIDSMGKGIFAEIFSDNYPYNIHPSKILGKMIDHAWDKFPDYDWTTIKEEISGTGWKGEDKNFEKYRQVHHES